MNLSIQDPRKFSDVYPDSNMLINQSIHDLKHNENNALMCALIEDMLIQQQDQTLSVGFSLSPSLAIANYIWESLQTSINSSPDAKLFLFALPIILVVGSKSQVVLKNQVDTTEIIELFKQHNLINGEFKLYEELVDIEKISKIKPSTMRMFTELNLAELDLTKYLTSNPVRNTGENIYIKFMVGCADIHIDKTAFLAKFAECNMEFMQLINKLIKTDDTTIFPITFAPCNLSESSVVGNNYYNEIAITFKLSNEVKKYRLQGKVPFIKLSTIDNIIQINLCEKSTNETILQLNWNLHPVDNFNQISETLYQLFADMQLEIVYANE